MQIDAKHDPEFARFHDAIWELWRKAAKTKEEQHAKSCFVETVAVKDWGDAAGEVQPVTYFFPPVEFFERMGGA